MTYAAERWCRRPYSSSQSFDSGGIDTIIRIIRGYLDKIDITIMISCQGAGVLPGFIDRDAPAVRKRSLLDFAVAKI